MRGYDRQANRALQLPLRHAQVRVHVERSIRSRAWRPANAVYLAHVDEVHYDMLDPQDFEDGGVPLKRGQKQGMRNWLKRGNRRRRKLWRRIPWFLLRAKCSAKREAT